MPTAQTVVFETQFLGLLVGEGEERIVLGQLLVRHRELVQTSTCHIPLTESTSHLANERKSRESRTDKRMVGQHALEE